MWQMVGILAELERSLIGERTKAGQDSGGRPWREDGTKAKINHTTGRTRPKTIRTWRNITTQ
jgi:DNA invertase Pin-like site-specific DNA recombinase